MQVLVEDISPFRRKVRLDSTDGRFILASRYVVGFDSWPKIDTSFCRPLCASTNRTDCTNMPPDPQTVKEPALERLEHVDTQPAV